MKAEIKGFLLMYRLFQYKHWFLPNFELKYFPLGRGALLIMPRPLLGCQIKAEIKGFLLVYRLFLYKHWFLPNFELKDFPEYTVTPCT